VSNWAAWRSPRLGIGAQKSRAGASAMHLVSVRLRWNAPLAQSGRWGDHLARWAAAC
jgi:hypothetical protein